MRHHLSRLSVLLGAVALAAGCADGVGVADSDGVSVLFSVEPPAAVSTAEIDALEGAFGDVDSYAITLRDSASNAVVLADTVPAPAGADEHRVDFALSPDLVGRVVLVTVVGLDAGLELYRASGYTTVQAVVGDPTPVVLSVRYTGPGIRGRVADDTGTGLGDVSVGLYEGGTPSQTVTTEPDGTYLFLGVQTGVFSVEPTPPGGLLLCPPTRSVNVQANDALVADFTATEAPCRIDLLVLSGGDVDDTDEVATMFAGTPGVDVDTYFYVNQTPGLNTLRQYDVVLLFNNGIFDETSGIGNELAAYVAAGGNLVIGSFYWQGRSDSEFTTPGWGDLEAIDPFTTNTAGVLQQGGATYEANDLGTVAEPTHPLIQGVTSLVSISGFSAGVLAKPSTTVVAYWTDGAPLVGYRILGAGQRIVAISLFPAADDPTQVAGDVQTLWENAIVWAGNAGGPIP